VTEGIKVKPMIYFGSKLTGLGQAQGIVEHDADSELYVQYMYTRPGTARNFSGL
jgi:hypothetical protein